MCIRDSRQVVAPVVGLSVDRLQLPRSTRIRPLPAPVIHVRLGARLTLEGSDLTPSLLSALKHAASMPNPLFYERQRRRVSTWDVPRSVSYTHLTLPTILRV